MDSLYDQLASPVWWMTAVLVGAVGSLVATRLDRFWAKFSGKRRERIAVLKAKRDVLVRRLSADPQEMLLFAHTVTYRWSRAIFLILLSIMLFLVASSFGSFLLDPLSLSLRIVGFIVFFVAWSESRTANDERRALDSARIKVEATRIMGVVDAERRARDEKPTFFNDSTSEHVQSNSLLESNPSPQVTEETSSVVDEPVLSPAASERQR